MARIEKAEHTKIVQMVQVQGRKVSEVAARYGCSPANIYAIVGRYQPAPKAAPAKAASSLAARSPAAAGRPRRQASAEPVGLPVALPDSAPEYGASAPLEPAPADAAPMPAMAEEVMEAESDTAAESVPEPVAEAVVAEECVADSVLSAVLETVAEAAAATVQPPASADAEPEEVAAASEASLVPLVPPPSSLPRPAARRGRRPASPPAPAAHAKPSDLFGATSDLSAPAQEARMPNAFHVDEAENLPPVPAPEPSTIVTMPRAAQPIRVPPVSVAAAAPPRRADKPAGRSGPALKGGYGLCMRTPEGDENTMPFRSLEDLLSAAKPLLRSAARSPEPVWFCISPVDLGSFDAD